MQKELRELIDKWEQQARFAFNSAKLEKTEFGKRFIEHGAMCYFNCANDLRTYLASASSQPLTTQEEHRRQRRQ